MKKGLVVVQSAFFLRNIYSRTLPFNASRRNSMVHSNFVELYWILSCTFFPVIFWRNNMVISSQCKKDPWDTKWGFLNFHNLDSITAIERDNETFFPSLFSPTCSQDIFFKFLFPFVEFIGAAIILQFSLERIILDFSQNCYSYTMFYMN